MTNYIDPELIWIEDRCYRTNDQDIASEFEEHDRYGNDIPYNDDLENNEDDEDMIISLENGKYGTSFHVAKHYQGAIIGKKGAMKSRIEFDTKTIIKVPKPGQNGDIVVYGPTPQSVRAARSRINIIVMSSRMKQRYTHFISIPMNSEEIMKNFLSFKEKVLSECSSKGVEESVFVKPPKLHITVGVMSLMDTEEIQIAAKLMDDAQKKIIIPLLKEYQPLRVRVRGLDCMNDDPASVHVLYGRVQEENASDGLLQELADKLVQHFYNAGYMEQQFGRVNVKLHVTLMNSKYRDRSSDAMEDDGNSRNIKRIPFDARLVLQKFAGYDFGVMNVTEIHLSQMHLTANDGYYQPSTTVSCKKPNIYC